MPHDHVKAALFYIVGSGLDAADGYAARYFKQGTISCMCVFTHASHIVVLSVLTGTKFGAVLDMVTDRFVPAVIVLLSIARAVCGVYGGMRV